MAESSEKANPTPPPPPTTEDLRWEREAEDARHGSLDDVRRSAEKWAAGIAGLLGVASTVAILASPDASKIHEDVAQLLVWLGAVTGVLSMTGLILAALASQGTPQWLDILDGTALRDHLESRTPIAIMQLKWSRWLIVASATLLVVIAVIATSSSLSKDETTQTFIVVFQDEPPRCGILSFDSEGRATLAGATLPPARQLLPVDSCPSISGPVSSN